MNLDRFLNLLATVFGTMGSVYVLKSLVRLSPNLIERLSRTYYDFSSAQIEALAGQKADSIVGVVLVVIALVLAVVNLAVVPDGVRVFESRGIALALVAVIGGASYIALASIGSAIHKHQKLAVRRIITAQDLGALLERKRLAASDVPSLKVYARTLLQMQVDDSEPPRLLLQRLAKEVGKQVPADFDFSEVEKR